MHPILFQIKVRYRHSIFHSLYYFILHIERNEPGAANPLLQRVCKKINDAVEEEEKKREKIEMIIHRASQQELNYSK